VEVDLTGVIQVDVRTTGLLDSLLDDTGSILIFPHVTYDGGA